MYNRKLYTNDTHVFGRRRIFSPRYERRAGMLWSKTFGCCLRVKPMRVLKMVLLGQSLHINIAPLESTEYFLTADLT